MKLKTRLRVTFISIIVLPLLLTILAFMAIAIYLMNGQPGGRISELDYATMSENMQEFVNMTDDAYFTLLEQAQVNPAKLEDRSYLEWVDTEIARQSTYIIARKGRGAENWYIGGVTNSNARSFRVTLDFLDEKKYRAKVYRDGEDAHYRDNPLSYKIDEYQVTKNDVIAIYVAPGGGFAIELEAID